MVFIDECIWKRVEEREEMLGHSMNNRLMNCEYCSGILSPISCPFFGL